MDGNQGSHGNSQRPGQHGPVQDGDENDEFQLPDGSDPRESRNGSTQSGGQNDGRGVPDRSEYPPPPGSDDLASYGYHAVDPRSFANILRPMPQAVSTLMQP